MGNQNLSRSLIVLSIPLFLIHALSFDGIQSGSIHRSSGGFMKIFGSKELTQNVIEKDLCIGCGACMDLCPYFASHKGKTANLFACTLEQGRCYAYCPKVATDLEDLSLKIHGTSSDGHALGHFRSIKISKAGPAANPGNFQCGGTVSALMAFGLKKGYLDAAVLTDREGVLPVPKLVTHPDEVYGCSGLQVYFGPNGFGGQPWHQTRI